MFDMYYTSSLSSQVFQIGFDLHEIFQFNVFVSIVDLINLFSDFF